MRRLALTLFAFTYVGLGAGASPAKADSLSCAKTLVSSTPAAPSPGRPCWTDYPYPFGSDGNPVTSGQPSCGAGGPFGPGWLGDYVTRGVNGNAVCYLQATSMAFRAWNRGLAATTIVTGGSGSSPYGVWLFNGQTWFPDPTFPGSAECPGTTVLWAGRLDYWLVGSSTGSVTAAQTLCRFDGVNLVWEPLTLPAATTARLPFNSGLGEPVGGITSGGCYAWDDCWFFGTDGIAVHWDGQRLTDASLGVAASPWLAGDFTGAALATDAAGNKFGFAVSRSHATVTTNPAFPSVGSQPDGSPPPQLWTSQGGPFAALPFSLPEVPQSGDPFPTDLVAVGANAAGAAWVAGDPGPGDTAASQPAPLLRVSESGSPDPCPYGANTFTSGAGVGYTWNALSVFPDGSVLVGAVVSNPPVSEPGLVQATCGQPPTTMQFTIPDPFQVDQATAAQVPADGAGQALAVAANAANDAWAATSSGTANDIANGTSAATRPHLYRWTDGQPPAAPSGNDDEARPSVFTLDPPVYIQAPPTVVQAPATTTTTTVPGRSKHIKAKAAIYSVHTRLMRGRNRSYTLIISFKVRIALRIGVDALRGHKVVAASGVKRLLPGSRQLALRIDPAHWPTHLKFVIPKATSH